MLFFVVNDFLCVFSSSWCEIKFLSRKVNIAGKVKFAAEILVSATRTLVNP